MRESYVESRFDHLRTLSARPQPVFEPIALKQLNMPCHRSRIVSGKISFCEKVAVRRKHLPTGSRLPIIMCRKLSLNHFCIQIEGVNLNWDNVRGFNLSQYTLGLF